MYTKHGYVEMWRGKGAGIIHLADSMEYEYSIADMVLEESTHTVLSEAQECK